jgi:iron-sulfur cluster repair protein YtfE (RIC family)
MHTVTDLEWEHAGLLASLVERCEAVASGWDSERVHALVAFLRGPFAEHARAEQAHFYPAIDALMRMGHGHPTDPMRREHAAISGLVNRLAGLADAYEGADESERVAMHTMLYRAAVQLEAVARLHMEAEEAAYLPLLVHLGAEERAALVERLREHEAEPVAAAAAAEG